MMRGERPRSPTNKACGLLPFSFVFCSAAISFYCIWLLRISAVSRPKKTSRLDNPIAYVPIFKSSYIREEKKEPVQIPESMKKTEKEPVQIPDSTEKESVQIAKSMKKEENEPAQIPESTEKEEKITEQRQWKEPEKEKIADPIAEKNDASVGSEERPEWVEGFRNEAGGVAADASPPEWCEILKQNPRERPRTGPLYRECGRPHNHVLCGDGKPMFFGSHNQDMYTWQTHFKHLEGKRKGVFLDIAANDPVSRSNTFFYERCLGWKGVCVEANPKYYPLLRNNRTCSLVKRCVSNKEETVEFIDDDGTGGISATNKNSWSQKKGKESRRTITCLKTKTALKYAVPEEEKLTIDFFSLDVEGHELQVLQGINWNTTKISVITVENSSEEIREFLQECGFHRKSMDRDDKGKILYGQMWNDVLYVHKSVVWGDPV